MAGPSRIERLVKHLGEENLPPKLPKVETYVPETTKHDTSKEDINKFTSTSESADGEDWWNAKPQLVKPPKAPINQQSSNPVPAKPVITNSGGITYPFDERVGEPAPLGLNFCPLLAVAKFPYKFVPKKLLQPIATAFFDEGKVWTRGWDV